MDNEVYMKSVTGHILKMAGKDVCFFKNMHDCLSLL